MDKLTISKAHVEDIDEIISLAQKIWKPAFSIYFSEIELNSLFEGMYSHQKLLTLLSDLFYQFFFIEFDGSRIGYFAVRQNRDHLKLDKIYVDQKFQKQGIGKWVFEKVRLKAIDLGFRQIRLNVNRRNIPAINFYEKLNFSITGEEDIAGPNGFIYDDYIMTYNVL